MKADLTITSSQNGRIKELIALRDRKGRDRSLRYLIEGYRELLRACDAGVAFETLFICPELFLGENEPQLIQRIRQSGALIIECPESLFRKVAYRDRPDGLIAVSPQRELPLSGLEPLRGSPAAPFFLIAESIEKPGNLGTILRSSDAAGVDGLILCDECTDLYNPNVVRASVGTLFTVPIACCTSSEALSYLKSQGVAVLAATPHAEKLYTEVDLRVPVAIAVGTEQLGLSEQWMKEADLQVRIPMYGVADSLNVATATTLLLYEVRRQRRA